MSPASAGAVTLGSHHMDLAQTEKESTCSAETCSGVQTKLPGALVRAPFSGEIRTWRVVTSGPNSYQLAVLHKKPNGKFKNVGVSSVESTPGFGEFEFSTSLSIHKGDYIALVGKVFEFIRNKKGVGVVFNPALEFPDARKPDSRGPGELQFNATVKH